MSTEALLFAGYGAFLLMIAALLEWLSAHTHRRSLRYRTAGFTFHEELDHWVCPEGEQELAIERIRSGVRRSGIRLPRIRISSIRRPAAIEVPRVRDVSRIALASTIQIASVRLIARILIAATGVRLSVSAVRLAAARIRQRGPTAVIVRAVISSRRSVVVAAGSESEREQSREQEAGWAMYGRHGFI